MKAIDKLVRKNIKDLSPYSSARDEYQSGDGIFMDANENPFGALNRYPDPYQAELKNAIAKLKNVNPGYVFTGNGSDEIIDLLLRIFCEPGSDTAVIFPPTYGMYEVAAYINNIKLLKLPLDQSFQLPVKTFKRMTNDGSIKLAFICSPNNPTGNSMSTGDIEEIIRVFEGIVIIDEAYVDFCRTGSHKNLVKKYPNVVILQTFSKAWGMAGARVGMAFAQPAIISYLNKVKPPYNISTINQQAVLNRMKDAERFEKEVKIILAEKEKMIDKLSQIHVVERIYPSEANFVLVKFKNAKQVLAGLADKGVIVRDRTKVVNDSLRITIGSPDENKMLLNNLKKIVNAKSIVY